MSEPTSTPTDRRTVICLGDSHTRGFWGASWLKLLRPQLPHLRLVNAGNDGEPSASIAARLPGLLAAHPDPAAVTIFSGSNDCISQGSWQLAEHYRWRFGLKQQCSEQEALDNLEAMVTMVQQQAPRAKVIVITLPVMLEDPRHSANRRALQYSTKAAQLVRSKYPGVALVDFQAACRQHMAQHSPKWQQREQEMQQQEPSTSDDSSYSFGMWHIGAHMHWAKYYQSMLLKRGWDDISRQQGLLLLTDGIHINDTAAQILAGLVQPLLQGL